MQSRELKGGIKNSHFLQEHHSLNTKGQGGFSISDVSHIIQMSSLKGRDNSMGTPPLILTLSSGSGRMKQKANT